MKAAEIRLAKINDLLDRLVAIEAPRDVVVDGFKYPALPIADARFFAARRLHALGEKITQLELLERYEDAQEVRRTRERVRRIWEGLAHR